MSSSLGYWSGTSGMDGCFDLNHDCLAAAVFDMALRITVLSVAGLAYLQSNLSVSTVDSVIYTTLISSPHGRTSPCTINTT